MPTPTLILIHGYPLDHTLWDYVIAPLREVTQVLTPDLPGFGGKPPLATEPSIDRMADEIAKLFVNEHIDHAVVAGMSMGGYVALSLAERYRHRLAGIALISTQSTADSEEARAARLQMIESVRARGTAAASEAILKRLFAPVNVSNESFRQRVVRSAERAGVEGICWALQAMASRSDRTDILSELHFPSLVVHGSEDQIIPAERARQMAGCLQDSEYVEIPNAGHAIPWEAPEQLVDELIGLLRRAEAAEPHLEGQLNRPGVVIAPTDNGL